VHGGSEALTVAVIATEAPAAATVRRERLIHSLKCHGERHGLCAFLRPVPGRRTKLTPVSHDESSQSRSEVVQASYALNIVLVSGAPALNGEGDHKLIAAAGGIRGGKGQIDKYNKRK
jgi:hypothetical protein